MRERGRCYELQDLDKGDRFYFKNNKGQKVWELHEKAISGKTKKITSVTCLDTTKRHRNDEKFKPYKLVVFLRSAKTSKI